MSGEGLEPSTGRELERVKITLWEHDPAWAAAFRRISARIREALGPRALVVEHVGSTAVPGLCAKAVIDIVLVVSDASEEASYAEALVSSGFDFHRREPEWHEHRMFKLTEPPTNLHVFSSGCPEVERMLRFRDLLRTQERARALYEARKRELAGREWARVQEYADEKTEVVERLLTWATDSPGESTG